MYTPASFAETDQSKLQDLIENQSFATLVSVGECEPIASHLPLLLDRQTEPHGRLVGHMARANPQWKSADGQPVLAIFTGPHTYISPTWYESKNVVPTVKNMDPGMASLRAGMRAETSPGHCVYYR